MLAVSKNLKINAIISQTGVGGHEPNFFILKMKDRKMKNDTKGEDGITNRKPLFSATLITRMPKLRKDNGR